MMNNPKYLILSGEPATRLLMRYKCCPDAIAWEYRLVTVIHFEYSWEARNAFEAIKKICKDAGKKILSRNQRVFAFEDITIYLRENINWNRLNCGEQQQKKLEELHNDNE